MTQYDPDEILRRGLATAGSAFRGPDAEQKIAEHLVDSQNPVDVAAALAKALTLLVEPGRVGHLDGLCEELAEAMFDDAHEGCDDEPCTGGGRPYYNEYVKDVVRPVLERYAVKREAVSP